MRTNICLFLQYFSMAGDPNQGYFFCRPADHGKGFKWQRVVAAQVGKSIFYPCVGPKVIIGREWIETQLPSAGPGGSDWASAMKVTLVMAITQDGKIGRSPNHFPDWTGKEGKKLFAEISMDLKLEAVERVWSDLVCLKYKIIK